MADLSIVEFSVYGLIAYSGLIMLVISTIKETPQTKSQSFTRAMYLIPSIICAFLLAGSGQVIGLETETTNIAQQVLNSGDGVQTLNTIETVTKSITLENSIWVLVHFMVGIMLVFHVILQSMQLLLFRE